jgi:hypothetical protein
VKLRPGSAENLARLQHQLNRFAQKWKAGTVTPLDPVGHQALVALPRLVQLADDPERLFLQGGIHIMQRSPVGRPHHQTVGPHGKTNGTALAAFELVSHHGVAQTRFAIGPGVAKGGGGHQVVQRFARLVDANSSFFYSWLRTVYLRNRLI